MKIVLYPQLSKELLNQVQRTAQNSEINMPDRNAIMEAVINAEVLFGSYTLKMIQAAKNLKWIQSTSAGMDELLPNIVDRDIIITNASGVHAIQVAEHAWALSAILYRGLHKAIRNQLAHKWQRSLQSDLYGSTVGIIGFGGIGKHYANLAQWAQMRILALDIQGGNKPDYVEALWGMDRLDDVLQASDLIFLACPHTPETDKLINTRTLKLMKRTAFLVNTARGKIVDEIALVDALKRGEIAGAGLDVFEKEPLPMDSPLWNLENVILTPHAAGGSPNRDQRTIDFFCQNLKRYLSGEKLYNEVDKTLGYPKIDFLVT